MSGEIEMVTMDDDVGSGAACFFLFASRARVCVSYRRSYVCSFAVFDCRTTRALAADTRVVVEVPLQTFTPVADESSGVVDEVATDAKAGLLGGKSKRRVYIDRTPALNFVVELFGTTILCLVIFICRGYVAASRALRTRTANACC